jgi:hypothetical protein
MQPTASLATASPIAVPHIDSDVPVAIIPIASVAPLDGPPDGERINTFTLAPKSEQSAADGFDNMRHRVLEKPLTCVAAAFSLGFLVGRVLR